VASIRAAYLPFGFTSIALLLGVTCLSFALAAVRSELLLRGALLLWAGLFWLSVMLCSLADAHCRIREYLRIRDLLQAYGFRPRLYQERSRSRCQRDAVMQAARETGFQHEIRDYFAGLGYRWFHILPDTLVINPLTFFNRHFLKSTFLPCKPPPGRTKRRQPERAPRSGTTQTGPKRTNGKGPVGPSRRTLVGSPDMSGSFERMSTP